MNREAERIWARIVVLFDAVEEIKEKHPEPRTNRWQDIIRVFEQRIMIETKKLKELGD